MFGFKKEDKSDKEIKIPGTATMKNGKWEVRLGDKFTNQLKDLPPEVQIEINKMINDIQSGKIDPLTMGEKMCAYCGAHANLGDKDVGDSGNPTNMCKSCQSELI